MRKKRFEEYFGKKNEEGGGRMGEVKEESKRDGEKGRKRNKERGERRVEMRNVGS